MPPDRPTTSVERAPGDLGHPWHRVTFDFPDLRALVDWLRGSLALRPGATTASWIENADGNIAAFVGNGPRQREIADAILAAVSPPTLPDADRRATLEGRLLAVVSAHGGETIVASPAMERMVRELADALEEWPELARGVP